MNRYEVYGIEHNQLLGYVHAEDIDGACELAEARHGLPVWVISIGKRV